MAVNVIVLLVTLLVAGFLLVWACSPTLRRWIEAPKYRVLQWPNHYPDAARPEQKARDSETVPGRIPP
ncbi:MAG TPA: hypothetical protein VG013_24530 [Gemmataceae bacterium]|jgi:hypothetical protein|nr:hypothetical protein [Gemmataceae bacterium]